MNNKILFSLSFIFVILVIFSSMVVFPNWAFALGKYTIDAKINLKKLNNPQKLKVVAYSNGENKTKYLSGEDLKSNPAIASFQFNQKNDGLVTAVHRDEYAVCAYDVNPQTNNMKSYACIEGNLENPGGKNPVSIGSGPVMTLSSGPFKTVKGAQVKTPTIVVWIENIAGKKNLKDIGVVTMLKGEFKYKKIDAQKMLKESKDNIIRVPLDFDKTPELGPVRVGDYFFACVSANVLKPVEGNECEHRIVDHVGNIYNIVARHD